ncbi:ABC transporter, permease protein [Desulfocucumis palustris]|uniref:Transport permease protein n=1 Tax=Desulfocucumis palustris TaxID=1898651 RepID=A0A2L2XLG0_9FIRM|nr:ABC transporter permease [Desulfocucumis palustris]GBF34791.1 ABC transporter, permease protein [Desulfocucumis palustris]
METAAKSKHYFNDVGIMTNRCMCHAFRSVDTIITVIAMPVMFMLLFVYVFGGAINIGPQNGKYIDYMLPGILLMAISSGVAYAAVRLNSDVTKGIFERFHSMPIAKSSLLWGHVLTSVVSCAISLIVIVLIALLMGFRPSAGIGAWLVVTGILLLFTLATTWLAVVSGLLAKSAEGAGVFAYPLMFLPFISSAFVPTESMPGPVRAFAENQPVTSIVEAVRSLLMGQPVSNELWIALAWCLGILFVAYIFAMRAYRHKVA